VVIIERNLKIFRVGFCVCSSYERDIAMSLVPYSSLVNDCCVPESFSSFFTTPIQLLEWNFSPSMISRIVASKSFLFLHCLLAYLTVLFFYLIEIPLLKPTSVMKMGRLRTAIIIWITLKTSFHLMWHCSNLRSSIIGTSSWKATRWLQPSGAAFILCAFTSQ
jgi:hypothetical protein